MPSRAFVVAVSVSALVAIGGMSGSFMVAFLCSLAILFVMLTQVSRETGIGVGTIRARVRAAKRDGGHAVQTSVGTRQQKGLP